jgi:hypothetical protein
MFNHYPFIAPEHHVALESCIRNHNVITSPLLAELYKAALFNVDKQTQITGRHTSHLITANVRIGTATDAKTGFYVQLAKVEGQERPLLTVGSKWAMEQPNALQGNVATHIW